MNSEDNWRIDFKPDGKHGKQASNTPPPQNTTRFGHFLISAIPNQAEI